MTNLGSHHHTHITTSYTLLHLLLSHCLDVVNVKLGDHARKVEWIPASSGTVTLTLSHWLDVVNVKLGEHARKVHSPVGCIVQRYVPKAC